MNAALKSQIQTALQAFSNHPLRAASLSLFATLGYTSERTLAIKSVADFCAQFDPKNSLDQPSALKEQWQSVELLFQLTDEELSGNASLFKDTSVSSGLMRSYVFFAIELKSDSKDYARGKLAAITRHLNRLFPMPVMVLFKSGSRLSLAVINRRANKRTEAKDVMGKVTLIQNISVARPHKGHIDILASFAVPELQARKQAIGNFDELHAAWEAVFNVELLNKRFYEELSNWYFWARGQVNFPDDLEKDAEKRNATSVIRLLTRLIFCWFLKEKDLISERLFDVDELKALLAKFDPQGSQDGTYYRAILQNLFFATLNQPMNVGSSVQRRFAAEGSFQAQKEDYGNDALYRYESSFKDSTSALTLFEDIPFLNGGLFASLDSLDENGRKQYADGFSRSPKQQALVPNHLFFAEPQEIDLSADYGDAKKKRAKVRGLIHILQSYKFTIAESTPVEQEIALDPELLGNVFENLLASYNPETGESARKQTGSFYTPRPIVDYMVDESLKSYLARALRTALPKTSQQDAKTGLDILFAYTEREHSFNAKETEALIDAIHRCNILDPACGSGAYPMGILHKLVFILAKLDPNNALWMQKQITVVDALITNSYEMDDAGHRDRLIASLEERKTSIKADFCDNNLDYGRKLYLIENCIYGVDIQPIAIQISKLRFFISLVCDQKTSMDKSRNRGVRPLPNLEIKFVVANTLIGAKRSQDRSLFENTTVQNLERELEKIRHRYFAAQARKQKLALRKRDEEITQKILAELDADDFGNEDVRQRVTWNPYDQHTAATFFDHEKMFGPSLADGFDVVIGNPPYVQIQKFSAAQKTAWVREDYTVYGATADIYCLFYERGVQLLKEGGHLSYITSNKWMRAGYGEALRGYLASEVNTTAVLDFGMGLNFDSAATLTSIVNLTKSQSQNKTKCCLAIDTKAAMNDPAEYFINNANALPISKEPWVVLPPSTQRIKQQVESQGIALGDWAIRINRGILTGYNEAFYLSDQQRASLIAQDPKSADLILPLLRGRDIKRYGTGWHALDADDEKWMIATFPSLDLIEKKLPKGIAAHLQAYRASLEPKPKYFDGHTWLGRKTGTYQWFETQDPITYRDDFTKPKIIYPNMTKHLPFYYDSDEHFYTNDKAFIITSELENLPALTAQLNSSLFRFCFKDNFPDLLGNSYELRKIFFDKIPLKRPSVDQAKVLETLVLWVQAGKRTNAPAFKTAFVESLLDACVLEMYFAGEMQRCNLSFLPQIQELLGTSHSLEAFYDIANDSKHPLRNALLRLPVESPDLLGLILREGQT